MLLFTQNDTSFSFNRLMGLEVKHRKFFDRENITVNIALGRNDKGPDGSIFFPDIYLALLKLLSFVSHSSRHKAHLASFVCKEVRLVFVGLDLFLKLRVL